MDALLELLVRTRASGRCEYCQMPQQHSDLLFHCDHIVAIKHRGPDEADNLALACTHCNLHKGPNIAGVDPVSGQVARLFHPRKDVWSDHFAWAGAELLGKTDVGRVTVAVLEINHPDYLAARSALIDEGLFPP